MFTGLPCPLGLFLPSKSYGKNEEYIATEEIVLGNILIKHHIFRLMHHRVYLHKTFDGNIDQSDCHGLPRVLGQLVQYNLNHGFISRDGSAEQLEENTGLVGVGDIFDEGNIHAYACRLAGMCIIIDPLYPQ